MCRTALRLIVAIFASFPLLHSGPSRAADIVPAEVKKTYSADDPVVKLALRFKETGIGFFGCDEQGQFRNRKEGRLVPGYYTLVGPGDDGRYSFDSPLERLRGLSVGAHRYAREVLSEEEIATAVEQFRDIEVLHLCGDGRRMLRWVEHLHSFHNLKELAVPEVIGRSKMKDGKPAGWTAEYRAEASRMLLKAVTRMKGLKRLDVGRCDLHDDDIRLIAPLDSLEELKVAFPYRRTQDWSAPPAPRHDFSVTAILDCAAGMKSLRHLDISGRRWEGPIDWRKLAALPRLESLSLASTRINDESLAGIDALVHLKTLDLSNTWITAKSCEHLAGLTNLKSLNLSDTPMTGESFDRLAGLVNLETLNLEGTKVTGGILALGRLPKLKEVDYPSKASPDPSRETFSDHPLEPEELDVFLRTCKAGDRATVARPEERPLWELNRLLPGGIRTIEYQVSGGPRISLSSAERAPGTSNPLRYFGLKRAPAEADFERLEELTEVTSVRIDSTYKSLLSDAQIADFASLPGLKSLYLKLDRPVTRTMLSPFAGNSTIESLALYGVQLDEEAMRHIASMPRLRSLRCEDGKLESAGWRFFAQAANLKTLYLSSISIDGPPGEHLRGLEDIPALEYLTIAGADCDDAECRWVGRCRLLKGLNLGGDFSVEGLARLTPMPNLENLRAGSFDIPRPREQLRILGRNRRLRWAGISGKHEKGHTNNIYSDAVARELGIGMDGACSCGCMDIEPDKAFVVPPARFRIEEGRLVIDRKLLDAMNHKDSWMWYSGRLRFLVPIERPHLRIERGDLPNRLNAIYFNECRVGRLEFIDCDIEEIGVFGKSEVRHMDLIQSEDRVARAAGKPNWSSQQSLYLSGVGEVTFRGSETCWYLIIEGCDRLRALWLDGDFPKLEHMSLQHMPRLKYLGAPRSGSAGKLRFGAWGKYFHWVAQFPSLRLLKMPGTGIGTHDLDSKFPVSMPPLHEVDLRKTQIGDAWLGQLAKIKTLRILRIGGCENLTSEGIAQFRRTRPEVEVVE